MSCPSVDSGAFRAPVTTSQSMSMRSRYLLPALVNRRRSGSWFVEPVDTGVATYRVRDEQGAWLGQVVAPRHPNAPGFGGETVYLSRPQLPPVAA